MRALLAARRRLRRMRLLRRLVGCLVRSALLRFHAARDLRLLARRGGIHLVDRRAARRQQEAGASVADALAAFIQRLKLCRFRYGHVRLGVHIAVNGTEVQRVMQPLDGREVIRPAGARGTPPCLDGRRVVVALVLVARQRFDVDVVFCRDVAAELDVGFREDDLAERVRQFDVVAALFKMRPALVSIRRRRIDVRRAAREDRAAVRRLDRRRALHRREIRRELVGRLLLARRRHRARGNRGQHDVAARIRRGHERAAREAGDRPLPVSRIDVHELAEIDGVRDIRDVPVRICHRRARAQLRRALELDVRRAQLDAIHGIQLAGDLDRRLGIHGIRVPRDIFRHLREGHVVFVEQLVIRALRRRQEVDRTRIDDASRADRDAVMRKEEQLPADEALAAIDRVDRALDVDRPVDEIEQTGGVRVRALRLKAHVRDPPAVERKRGEAAHRVFAVHLVRVDMVDAAGRFDLLAVRLRDARRSRRAGKRQKERLRAQKTEQDPRREIPVLRQMFWFVSMKNVHGVRLPWRNPCITCRSSLCSKATIT